jgi:hypothetical protein
MYNVVRISSTARCCELFGGISKTSGGCVAKLWEMGGEQERAGAGPCLSGSLYTQSSGHP